MRSAVAFARARVLCEIRHAATRISYWVRPYDMLADRRRWFWEPRTPCGFQCGLRLESVRLCAQCQLSAGVDRPVGDPQCPHKGQGWHQ